MNIKGNELSFKTYKSAKVNETDLSLPEVDIKDFYLPSQGNKVDDFAEDSYGISRDLVNFNENKANLYRSYTSKDHSQILDIRLDKDNPNLVDIHDLVAGAGDEINLVLNYESQDDIAKFRSSLIRIYAKENSKVRVYVISMDDMNTQVLESIYAKLDKGAEVRVYEYRLGAKSLVSNTKGELVGEGSDLKIDSIYFAYGEDKLDLHYDLVHHGRSSKSDLIVNGAMKDRSYKKFKSTLDFKPGSSESDGSEVENVILLSDEAKSMSVPVLLSGEDDVAGNHAASAGRLDDSMIFYLMSRGLTQAEAESMVINSRFSSSIDALEDESHKEKIWTKVKEIME